MNITEAIVQLDNWQAQIIHGPTLFREIADVLRETVKQKNDAQVALKNLLAIKAAKDAQGTSSAYRAAKRLAWQTAEELVGPQPIRADLDCPRCATNKEENVRPLAPADTETPIQNGHS